MYSHSMPVMVICCSHWHSWGGNVQNHMPGDLCRHSSTLPSISCFFDMSLRYYLPADLSVKSFGGHRPTKQARKLKHWAAIKYTAASLYAPWKGSDTKHNTNTLTQKTAGSMKTSVATPYIFSHDLWCHKSWIEKQTLSLHRHHTAHSIKKLCDGGAWSSCHCLTRFWLQLSGQVWQILTSAGGALASCSPTLFSTDGPASRFMTSLNLYHVPGSAEKNLVTKYEFMSGTGTHGLNYIWCCMPFVT